jgi:hypothetical protein
MHTMTRVFAATVLLLLICAPAFAEQSPTPSTVATQKQVADGTKKMWIGAGMIAAGLIIMPITAPGSRDGQPMVGGILAGTGMVVFAWGNFQRYNATHPSVRIGVRAGRTTSVAVVKAW